MREQIDASSQGLMLTRGELFKLGLAAGALAVLKGGEVFWRRFLPNAPEAQDIIPSAVFDGSVAIYRGARLRTSPRIPDMTKFRQPTNKIEWSEIVSVNGTLLMQSDVFVINRPEIIKGQPVDRIESSHRIKPDGTRVADKYIPTKNKWIKLTIRLHNSEAGFPVYINLWGSSPWVQLLIFNGEDLPSNSEGRGQIFIPTSAERAARDVLPLIWSKVVADKLGGKVPLRPKRNYRFGNGYEYHDPGERIVPTALVVVSGDTLEEKMEMERLKTPVNVRNYSAKLYYNDEPVEIVGVVAQGTEIRNLLVGGNWGWWAACRRRDILGDLYDGRGNSVKTDPDKIVAISTLYLSYFSESRPDRYLPDLDKPMI